MSGIFITGSGTGVGKTFIAAALIHQAKKAGEKISALKPVMSGGDEDARILLEALGEEANENAIACISPFSFSAAVAPHIAAKREGKALSLDMVVGACVKADVYTIIEGAGGVMTPISNEHTMRDVIVALKLPAVLVVGSYLGSISHALASLEALQTKSIHVKAVIVSESEDPPMPLDETVQSLQHFTNVRVVGVPRLRHFTYAPELWSLCKN